MFQSVFKETESIVVLLISKVNYLFFRRT